MRRINGFLALMAAVIVVSAAVSAAAQIYQFDFLAPTVSDRAEIEPFAAPGLIVYDSSKARFYGRTDVQSPPWVELSPPHLGASVPTGTILPFGGKAPPPGYLLCDGKKYKKTEKKALYDVIQAAFGDEGEYFHVPNLQGQFVRGWDNGRGLDPDRADRTASGPNGYAGDRIGSQQPSGHAKHRHGMQGADLVAGLVNRNQGEDWGRVGGNKGRKSVVVTADAGGEETRPVNVYLNFIIKD